MAPERHLKCGVPSCEDGRPTIVGTSTVVECDTHNARTTWDTEFREPKEQQVIRVQDQWRQHGTSKPPR